MVVICIVYIVFISRLLNVNDEYGKMTHQEIGDRGFIIYCWKINNNRSRFL